MPLPETNDSFYTVRGQGSSLGLPQGPFQGHSPVHWRLWGLKVPEFGLIAPRPGPMLHPKISVLRPRLPAFSALSLCPGNYPITISKYN